MLLQALLLLSISQASSLRLEHVPRQVLLKLRSNASMKTILFSKP